MSEVCSERTPLHASFTPTTPLLIRMTLPSSCAGTPKSAIVSVAIPATIRMRPCTIGPSIGVTHGTATKINATGKAKCRTQGRPPICRKKSNVIPTTIAACIQPSGRQSGLPSSKRRTGRRRKRSKKDERRRKRDADFLLLNSSSFLPAAGRSSHRSQNENAAKKGTNQP